MTGTPSNSAYWRTRCLVRVAFIARRVGDHQPGPHPDPFGQLDGVLDPLALHDARRLQEEDARPAPRPEPLAHRPHSHRGGGGGWSKSITFGITVAEMPVRRLSSLAASELITTWRMDGRSGGNAIRR